MNISAILWDYDGTIIDSTRKNMVVTLEVLKHFISDINNNIPSELTSIEKYQEANYKYKNWKDFYKNCYGLSDEEVNEAGKLWSPCQLADDTIPDMFSEVNEVIKSFGDIKQGICSQNCSKNIEKTLKIFELSKYFQSIIGYQDVSYDEQKPNPSGFIKCVENLKISINNSTMIYIGDHQEDTIFGKNAEEYYRGKGYNVKVICIAASYSGHSTDNWIVKPDFIAYSTTDIINIIKRLLEER